jgi:hypothetical protein
MSNRIHSTIAIAFFFVATVTQAQIQQSISVGAGTLTFSYTSTTLPCSVGNEVLYSYYGWRFTAPGIDEILSDPNIGYMSGGYGCPSVGATGPNPADLVGTNETIHVVLTSPGPTTNPPGISASLDMKGFVIPKYVILSVIYAPPSGRGAASSVNYGTTSAVGTSSDIVTETQKKAGVSIKVEAGTSGPIARSIVGTGRSFEYSQSSNTTTSISINRTSTNQLQFTNKFTNSVGVNHDNDVILLWLNPVANFILPASSDVLKWTGFGFDPRDTRACFPVGCMEVVAVRVGDLKSGQLGENTVAFQRTWDTTYRFGDTSAITPADYPNILAADPFANGGMTLDPDRFDPVANGGTFLFSPGGTQTYTSTYATTTGSGTKSSTSYSVGSGVEYKFGVLGAKLTAAFSNSITWTNVANQNTSQTAGQTASFSIAGPSPSDNYTGPGTFNVYKDNVYGTFLFVPAPAATRFVPLTPCRLVDTRNPSGPFGGPSLNAANNYSRDFNVAQGSCQVPSNAKAYSLNFTVVPTGGLGWLNALATGSAPTTTSILNSDGRVKSNAAIVSAGIGNSISVSSSNQTDLILDINGYFVEAGTFIGGELGLYPLIAPCRLIDTRGANGPLGGPYLAGGQGRTIPILSSGCSLPATAKAYALNFTAIPRQQQPLGYLSTWPTGLPQPTVSTLNAPTGSVTANAAIVPAGTAGSIQVYASNDTDLVIDVNGYFAAPLPTSLSLYRLSPCRVLDTRLVNNGTPLVGSSTVATSASPCLLGALNPRLYVMNTTVVPQGGLGFLSLWPDLSPFPGVSTLNSSDGTVTSNLAFVSTNSGGTNVLASNPTQLILDISSYFAP